MEPGNHERLQDLFVALLDLDSSDQAAFLAKVHSEDANLAARLEEMVGNFQDWDEGVMDKLKPDALIKSAENTRTPTLAHSKKNQEPEPSSIPQKIGAYRILELIGEGGMGHVFLAEQESPCRKVALKLISSSYGTSTARKRFRSEYQAQAMMKNQHIAQLIEAGTTKRGETFFTMEYLDGQPITTYCKENNLSPLERLRLFRQVCRGVQHAHQRAILHRDLKPSNVLVVTTKDGPVAKIIDFGLAKSLAGGDDFSDITHQGQIIGTPIYMSPEQIKGQLIDTRGDIYALGIMLYELLAHRHPLDQEALKKLSLNEMLTVCALEEPPAPSLRIREAVAVGSASKKDYAYIRGDLDQITMKAMSKDIERRYSSVTSLIYDIDNFMADRPVMARSPGLAYLISRFFKRNKLLVIASTLTLGALVIGFSVATISAIKLTRAQQETKAALARYEVSAGVLEDAFTSPDPRSQGPDALVVDLLTVLDHRLQQAERDSELIGSLRTTWGRTYFGLGMYDEAEQQLKQALQAQLEHAGEADPKTSMTRYHLALTLMRKSQHQQALMFINDCLKFQALDPGPEHPDYLRSKACKAMILRRQQDYDAARVLFKRVLARQQSLLGLDHPDAARSLVGLGNSLHGQGAYAAAEAQYRKALAIQEADPHNPETLVTRHLIGHVLLGQKRYQEAEPWLEEVIALRSKVLGKFHPLTLGTRNLLARCYYSQNQYTRAEKMLLTLLEESRLSDLDPATEELLAARNRLAVIYGKTDRTGEAITVLQDLQEIAFRKGRQHSPETLKAQHNLAYWLYKRGDISAAIECYERTLYGRTQTLGLADPKTLGTWSDLAEIYVSEGFADHGYFLSQPWLIAREARPRHANTMTYGLNYANWLVDVSRFHEAEVILAELEQIACQKDGPEHKTIEKALKRLAEEKTKYL